MGLGLGLGLDKLILRRAGSIVNPFQDANVAFSLRDLKLGVTDVVRVRRDSDNTEQDFSANQILQPSTTAGSLLNFVGAGNGFVTIWYDQAGTNDATQPTATLQPQIVNAGNLILENGKPAILFDNNGTDGLVLDSISTNLSMFFVLSTTYNTSGTYTNFLLGNKNIQSEYHGSNNLKIINASFSSNSVKNGNNYLNSVLSDFNVTPTPTSQSLLSMLHSGNVSFNTISKDRGFPGRSWRGYRQCIVGFNDNSQSLRNSVEANINSYYNIY